MKFKPRGKFIPGY